MSGAARTGREGLSMARMSLLSDDLVRQLMAVGQVDILVGVPTFKNAATVQSVVTTLHVGLAKHFPRERTVLLNADALFTSRTLWNDPALGIDWPLDGEPLLKPADPRGLPLADIETLP